MRKFIVFVMVVALVFTVSCTKEEEKKPAEEKKTEEKVEVKKPEKKASILDVLPENAHLVVKFASLETTYKQGSVSETSAFGRPIENLEEIKEKLGFNPFNIDEVKAQGFDPAKEFGLAVADIVVEEGSDEPNFNGLLFIPVTDGKKAIETIKAAIQKDNPEVQFTPEGDMTVASVEGEEDKFYLQEQDNILFIAANPKVDAKPFLESVIAKKSSLTNSGTFKDVAAKVSPEEELFVYANIAKIVENNLGTLKNLSKQSIGAAPGAPDVTGSLDYLSDYQGVGVSLDLGNPNFMLKSVVNLVADSRSLKLWQGTEVNKGAVLGVPENSGVLLSIIVNVAEAYKMIVDAMPEEDANNVKMQLEGMKEMLGIDIENEIINNLGGNLNLGVYDGASITMGTFNTILTLSVKDEAVTTGLLDKAIAMMPPPQQEMVTKQTVGEVEAYVIMGPMLPVQLYMGVKDKNLIAAVGKPMFEKALKADVSSGFTANIADKELAETLKGDGNVLYVNVDETMKAVKNFEMFLQGFTGEEGINQQIQDAVGKFEYVLASKKLDGNSILAAFTIKTKFTEPFFIEVEKLSKSFEAPPAQPE